MSRECVVLTLIVERENEQTVSWPRTSSATHLDETIGTVTLTHDQPTTMKKVEDFLQKLLWEEDWPPSATADGSSGQAPCRREVMRLKALVTLEEALPGSSEKGKASATVTRQVIIQGVHDTFDTYERDVRDTKVPCLFVLIGRHLDRVALQAGLDAVLSPDGLQ